MPSRGELRSRPVPVSNPGTRHRRDPSPPRSCSIASFWLWPLAIIPHKRNEQASGVKRHDSAHTRQQHQPCVTEHRFPLPLTRMPKTPHYRIPSHQIAPSSLDSGLPSTSPPPRRVHGKRSRGRATLPTRASTKRAHMHHGTSRGKPKRIPRAGSAMTRRRGSAMTHHDLIRMTVDSRVLGHLQSRQINPNRGPSRAPTGLNPPPSPITPLYWERRLISCFRSCIPRWPPLPMGPRHS